MKQLQFRRYANTLLNSITGRDGELIVDKTNKTLTVHDGLVAGGSRLATEQYVNIKTQRPEDVQVPGTLQVGLTSSNGWNFEIDSTGRISIGDYNNTNTWYYLPSEAGDQNQVLAIDTANNRAYWTDAPLGSGSQGVQGSIGAQGLRGFQGERGDRGFQGFQGRIGVNGSVGPQGAQGSVGTQGAQGRTGNNGAQGFQGSTGEEGPQGYTGFQGYQGFQGEQGERGFIGFQGITGEQGPQGFTGYQGDRGFQGYQGYQGIKGDEGVQGPAGDKYRTFSFDEINLSSYNNGNTISLFVSDFDLGYTPQQEVILSSNDVPNNFIIGKIYNYDTTNNQIEISITNNSNTQNVTSNTWSLNLNGAIGIRGFQGSRGFQGEIGSSGNQGFQGYQGTQGFQGARGFQGDQGSQGTTGNTGTQGAIGTQGFQGARGFQGYQGYQGAVGTQGYQGDQGFQGSIGAQGSQGDIGAQGNQGEQGFQGATGTTEDIGQFEQANAAFEQANAAFFAANNITSVSYTQNIQSNTYQLNYFDSGKYIYSSNTTRQNILIPNNETIPWDLGTTILLVIQGTGSMNVVAQQGVTLYVANNSTPKKSANVYPYGMATLLNVEANTWFIDGRGVD